MTELMKRAVGYVRTSCSLNPKASIPNQQRLINEYCENRNIFLDRIYVDDSKTATRVDGREGYLELKTNLAYGDIDMVIVSYFDRLARESYEFVLTVLDLNNRGIEIVSVSEDLSSKSMSPIQLGIAAFEIEYENQQRTERIHGSIQENRKRGIYNLPHVPIGYKKDEESRLIVDRENELLVKQIYETYINTKSIYETAGRFESLDLDQIEKILENKTYTGFIYTKGKEFKENSEYIQWSYVKHESIIDEMTFEKVFFMRKVERKQKRHLKRYLLQHIFKCPQCKSIMDSKKGKYYCKSCKDERTKFPQDEIEKKFTDYLKSSSFEFDFLTENQVNKNPKIVDEIENRRKNIEDEFSKAKISLVKYQEEIKSLEIQGRKMNKKINLNNQFTLKYEIEDLIRNKTWYKLSRRFSDEKLYVTLDEINSNIKLLKNG